MAKDTHRYSRQLSLTAFGTDGQQRLDAASILIIGAGGLGAPAGLYLASSGVGHIAINDFDTVDVTNLPRQILFRDADIDEPKAEIAASRLRAVNPNIICEALPGRLDMESLAGHIGNASVVLDCTDNFPSRWMINEICVQQRTNLIVGSAIRLEGQLAVFRHDVRGGPCYRCLYSEADENINDCTGQGILPPVAGTVGCMMATEAIKLLLGIESELQDQLWIYDAGSGKSRVLKIPVREDCPVCKADK